MKVLFTVTHWRGIYFHVVPLGWALRAASHDVRVVCSQAEPVSRAGLVPVPVLEGFDLMRGERLARYAAAVRSPGGTPGVPPLHPATGRPVTDLAAHTDADLDAHQEAYQRDLHANLARNCDATVGFAREWRPDLVVHDMMTPEGVLAALVTGVPSVYYSPGLFGSAEADLHDRTGAFPRHGVNGWDRTQVRYAVDPSPDMMAPDMGDALRLPVRYVPYNGPGALAPWMTRPARKPRICLMWSRSATAIFGPGLPVLRHAVDAVLATGAELVLTAGAEEVAVLGDLPDGVRVLTEQPLHLILEHCDAIIHTGSISPMMTASGLPQLILALTDDGAEIGRRFATAGSALVLPGLTATAGQVHAAVRRLRQDEGLREAAKRVRAAMDEHPTVADLVPALETLARTGTLSAADASRAAGPTPRRKQ